MVFESTGLRVVDGEVVMDLDWTPVAEDEGGVEEARRLVHRGKVEATSDVLTVEDPVCQQAPTPAHSEGGPEP